MTKRGYIHPRIYVSSSPGRMTRATMYYEISGNDITYSVALCSIKDRFNRKTGRKLAKARWDAGDRYTSTYQPTFTELALKACIDTEKRIHAKGHPTWMKKGTIYV